jgi:hypothetical protein
MIDQAAQLFLGLATLFLYGGGIWVTFAILCNLWDAHCRGMARVRAYDQRQLNRR